MFDLVPARPENIGGLGRICYEAFKDIADQHGFPPAYPSAAVAREALGMLVGKEGIYAVESLLDGRPVGSNFLFMLDEAAGVGPITVEAPLNGQGIGRALMEDVLAHARASGVASVRLLQDSFNMASLSLYASLGFEVKEAVALMQSAPSAQPDRSVRLVAEGDLDAVEELSRHLYKVSRRNEVAFAIKAGQLPLLRERNGRIAAYFVAGPGLLFTHGVAETEDDALALVGEAARRVPNARFFCPLSEGSLYRNALKAGCRAIKVMNLMAFGPYEPPDAVWLPSVEY